MRSAFAAVALTVLALAGCGDDDHHNRPTETPTAVDTSTPTPTLTAVPSTPTSIPSATAPFTATSTPSQVPTQVPTSSPTAVPSSTPTAEPTATATAPLTEAELLLTVAESQAWDLPGLTDEVQVLRTEGSVPHIYAHNRRDLAFAHGFTVARDRYFMLDLIRRLGLGQVSSLIGDGGLESDLEARLTGMTYVADRAAAGFSAEQGEQADAFAAGVNTYIAQVQARKLPLPSELRLAGALLGVSDPRQLMKPFTRRDIGGVLAVIVYQSSYETGDIGRDASFASIATTYAGGGPLSDLRQAGLEQDIVPSIQPFYPLGSAAGFGLEIGDQFIPGPVRPGFESSGAAARSAIAAASGAGLPSAQLAKLVERLEALETKLGRRDDGFGSNSWAVVGEHTASGGALIAGDGHLQLDIPALFVQIGLDTSVLGDGPIHQLGLTIPGFFVMPVGTNGSVGWSQTQLSSDLTDWYREQVQLDENGLPAATLFQGEWRPVERHDESYEIANVPALDSVGRTETWPRFTLFDGRFLAEVEGRHVGVDDPLGPGESRYYTMSGLVVPGDTNNDGVISGLSFDYTPFDVDQVIAGADGFGQSANVEEFRQHARKLVGYSQNLVAGDSNGDILYTSYNAVPCRGYLERLPDGRWAPGADPRGLLDGTKYAGFEVPKTDGVPDENAAGDDPYRCLVPFDSTPQSISPAKGYVFTANNDPAAIQRDGSLTDDPWYIGGTWDVGFRAHTIDKELHKLVERGEVTADDMAALQANHESRLGENFAPYLAEAIGYAHNLQLVDRVLSPAEQRIEALYAADAAAMDDVRQRMIGWGEGGYLAASGVESFYHSVAPGELDDAIATMIFNAWIGRFNRSVWSDEPINGGLFAEGDMTRLKLIHNFLLARDAGTTNYASYNPASGEAVYFDVFSSQDIETSRELMLQTLTEALTFLRSAPIEPGRGGFGTNDMTQWIWGLRHQVRFESLLAPFLGDDPNFAIFTRPFAIDTSKLPLAPNLANDDPRKGLRWFPRHGDQWGVDAANPGLSGTDFTHGNGAVMRMVFDLNHGEVSGYNIIPGGQSGLTDSPYFSDQTPYWLSNTAFPVRFHVKDVVAGATGREVYRPVLASGRCHDAAQCSTQGAVCLEPGGFIGCGACQPVEGDECATDFDCGELADGKICVEAAASDCLCQPAKICKRGCAGPDDCAPGLACDEDQRCRPSSCTSDADCPRQFVCGGVSPVEPTCVRQSCSEDRDCNGAFCVNGACYSDIGTCTLPPPAVA